MFSKADVLVSTFLFSQVEKIPFMLSRGAGWREAPRSSLQPDSLRRLTSHPREPGMVERKVVTKAAGKGGGRGEGNWEVRPGRPPILFPEHGVSMCHGFKQHYTHLSSEIKCY